MADEIKFEINQKDLQRLIRKLDASTKDETLRNGLNRARGYITKWIVENRMHGPRPDILGVKTGRLSNSVMASIKSPILKQGNSYIAVIGTNIVYARVHEYGYSKRNIPARPYLRPGIENRDNQLQAVKDIKDVVEEAIKKA